MHSLMFSPIGSRRQSALPRAQHLVRIRAFIFCLAMFGILPVLHAAAQNREFRTERIVINDGGADGTTNTMRIEAPNSLGQNVVLVIPDLGIDSLQFLLAPPGTPGAWLLGGNAGTTSGTHFLGTSDATALHLYVNSGSDNRLILNPNGSIQRDTAGNPRGVDAVDLQRNQFFDPSEAADGVVMVASGRQSTIAGGTYNIASGDYAVVGGGSLNSALNTASVVCGGNGNFATGLGSTVAGGFSNQATANSSVVLGGFSNEAFGNYSAILGGRFLTLQGSGSVGFMANTGSTIRRMIISDNNAAVFGNVDLWLANNDNGAGQIRFYEPNNTSDAFPNGANYSSFQAQAQTADIEYVLPSAAGTVGDQLTISGVAGTQVTLGWAAASDRSKKTSFLTLSGESVLEKFRTFELGTWRYDSAIDPKGARHYGIMAQDFHTAFGNDGLGEIGTDTTVTNLDLHGVSYLAIQGLEQRTAANADLIQMLREEIRLLRAENEELRRRFDGLSEVTGREP